MSSPRKPFAIALAVVMLLAMFVPATLAAPMDAQCLYRCADHHRSGLCSTRK